MTYFNNSVIRKWQERKTQEHDKLEQKKITINIQILLTII